MDSNTDLSMRWHKFLIYFALWASAVMNVVSGLSMLTGSQYGSSDMAAQIYAAFGGLKSADTIFGILLIALAAFLIYTRFQLAGFKEGAPNKLTIAYVLNLVITLAYYFAVSGSTKMPLGDILDSSTVSSLAASVVMLVVNRVYYNKRSHLFGDAGGSYGTAGSDTTSYTSAPSYSATSGASGSAAGGFCPKCGCKVEDGDAFCVNCGAKLMR